MIEYLRWCTPVMDFVSTQKYAQRLIQTQIQRIARIVEYSECRIIRGTCKSKRCVNPKSNIALRTTYRLWVVSRSLLLDMLIVSLRVDCEILVHDMGSETYLIS